MENYDTQSKRILELWEIYVANDKPFPETVPAGIRPVIFESWRRSKAAGVSPFTVEGIPTKEGLEAVNTPENRSLISVAHSYIENLYSFVRGSDFLIALTDKSGLVIDLIGLEGMIEERAKRSGLQIGCSRNETIAGTCGIGVCLALGAPVQIWGAEHFIKPHHGYVCSAAPVSDASGEIIGCIACIGPSEGVTKHTLGMICAAADGIEKEFGMRRAYDQLRIVNMTLNMTLDSISQGIIMINANGVITQANDSASKVLRLPGMHLTGENIRDLLDFSGSTLDIFALEENVSHRELDVINRKGIRLSLSVSASVFRSEQSKEAFRVLILEERDQFNKVATKAFGFTARYSFDQISGTSEQIAEIRQLGALAAQSDSNILISGESGTGKVALAHSIHNASARKNAPFVALNCADIPRNHVETELFGYDAKTFPGTSESGAPGKFELADGGTLFLDEIGDMPMEGQAALLRAIQTKEVTRVGGRTPKPINVRIIAATNLNLADLIESKRFRKDLFYSLNILTFRMPAIRERKEDLPILANELVATYNERLEMNVRGLTPEAMDAICSYDWPGNIRELENVIERAMNITSEAFLTEEDLGPEILRDRITTLTFGKPSTSDNQSAEEERLIRKALGAVKGNVTKAARLTNIPKRTLYRRIDSFGIDLSEFRG